VKGISNATSEEILNEKIVEFNSIKRMEKTEVEKPVEKIDEVPEVVPEVPEVEEEKIEIVQPEPVKAEEVVPEKIDINANVMTKKDRIDKKEVVAPVVIDEHD
jgi:hypothetical protein